MYVCTGGSTWNKIKKLWIYSPTFSGWVPFLTDLPAVDHVIVSPSNVTLAPGATQQFTAVAYDASNNAISGIDFTWGHSDFESGNDIDSNGLFTQGSQGGVVDTVTATSVPGGVQGTATVHSNF